MFFCPLCGNLLILQQLDCPDSLSNGSLAYCCQTCVYKQDIHENITKKTLFKRKAFSKHDLFDESEALKNAEQTDAMCQAQGCEHGRAYFIQMQTRSADEPMTIFYKCCQCGNQWNDR